MAKPVKKDPQKKKRKRPNSTSVSASARNTNTIKIQIGDKRVPRRAPRSAPRASAPRAPPAPPQIQQIPMPYPMYIPSIGQQSQQPVYATFNGRDNPSLLDKRIDNLTNGVEWLKEQMRQEIGDRVSMIKERLTVPSMVGDDVSDVGSYLSVPHWEDLDGVSSGEGNFETPVAVGEPEAVPRSEERDVIESTQSKSASFVTPEAKPSNKKTRGYTLEQWENSLSRSLTKEAEARFTYERNRTETNRNRYNNARDYVKYVKSRIEEAQTKKPSEEQTIATPQAEFRQIGGRRDETPMEPFYREGKYAR